MPGLAGGHLAGRGSARERLVAVETPPRRDEAEGGNPSSPGGGPVARWVWLVVAVVVAASAAGAILLRSSETGPAPVPVPPTTTAAAPLVVEEPPRTDDKVVADAYLAFEEAFKAAAQIPDPDWPGLGETATGSILQKTVDQLRAWKASGRVVRYPPGTVRILRPTTVQIQGGTATVRACAADGGQVVVAESGAVVNGDVVTRLQLVTLVLDDTGRWKVSEIKVEQRWEGVAGCAV